MRNSGITTAIATPARSIGCFALVIDRISRVRTVMKMAAATPSRAIAPMSRMRLCPLWRTEMGRRK